LLFWQLCFILNIEGQKFAPCEKNNLLEIMNHNHSHHQKHEHGSAHGKHANHAAHHEQMARDFKKRFFVALILSLPVLVLSPTIQGWLSYHIPSFAGDKIILFLLASIIALWAGWPFYKGARDELKKKELGMMVLVSLAVLTGYLYSVAATFFIPTAKDFYWEISTLVLVLLLGHWLEMRAVISTSGVLEELVKLIPPKANLIKKTDQVVEVESSQLKVGDMVLVKPGEKIPVDGRVVEGMSSVNEALITGESKPLSKSKGDEVIGGSINIDGSLKVEVNKIGEETALAQIIELVKNAQSSKPRTQRLADRAAHYLTIIAITAGTLTFLCWNFLLGGSFVFALSLAITVVVITCPHALGLAIPTVTTIVGSLAAKNGILIKDMTSIERIKDADWIIFDKTGTLTQGKFGVSDMIASNEHELLELAASLEQHSEHTLSAAILDEAHQRNIKPKQVKNFKAMAGKGVVGELRINPPISSSRNSRTARGDHPQGENKESKVLSGNQKLMQEMKVAIDKSTETRVRELESQGKTVIYVALDKRLIGVIALSDEIKAESKAAIDKLKSLDIKVAMLTGDNRETAGYVARQLKLDNYFAQVLPADKVDKVRELQKNGQKVIMVGDGINDAPALTQADVGVAIGAGTDVAIESAEVILVKNNPLDILKLINLSRKTMVKMKENLAWATGYNLIAIPLAAGVLYSWGVILRPEWGALAMTASSVIVVVNALMLKRANL
jgi:Cu2+-exporting ATPase